MQIENNQKYYSQYSLNHLPTISNGNDNNIYETIDDIVAAKNKNPLYHHRSEMNLLLSFDGDVQKITTVSAAMPETIDPENQVIDDNANDTTPPPQLPQPMQLFPPTLPYANEFNNIQQELSSIKSHLDVIDDQSSSPIQNKKIKKTGSSSADALKRRSLAAFRRQLFAKHLAPITTNCSLTATTTTLTYTTTTTTISMESTSCVTPSSTTTETTLTAATLTPITVIYRYRYL